MFNNLIESCSHRNEVRRRSYFFLFTTATYALLLALAGVASIYAYDARLKEQSTELVTLLSPADFLTPPVRISAPKQPSGQQQLGHNTQAFDERRSALASVNHPELPPEGIGTKPNASLPVRDGVPTLISDWDINSAPSGDTVGTARNGRILGSRIQLVTDLGVPPPISTPKAHPKIVSKGVVTGEAVTLPKPSYPEIAKRVGLQGTVAVQILIDEAGKVISAQVISGHPLFRTAVEKAAYGARFRPTLLGDQPVKVSGTITYNFVLQK